MGWNGQSYDDRRELLVATLICGAIILVCGFGAVWAIFQIAGYVL
jgi:hypothetical protein